MAKTSWVNQALAFGLLSLVAAATGCLADSSSETSGVAVDPGAQGNGGGNGGGEPSPDGRGGETAAPLPQPNRVPLPIVLVHGAAGFQDIGPIDYFAGVQARLLDEGHVVYAAAVAPLDLIEVRAAQLGVQIDAILQATGASRVHLIAHGEGGLDARYLVSKLAFGDRVATLTTIGTPHHGIRIADVALGIVPGPVAGAVDALVDLLFDGQQNVDGQLYQLTEQYAEEEFNVEVTPDSRVSYYSIAGVTNLLTLDLFRQDLCNPLLLPTILLTTDGPSDGLVTVESASYGELLGTIPADHFDEIGQFLGLSSLAFNHLSFYSRLARFITNLSAPAPI